MKETSRVLRKRVFTALVLGPIGLAYVIFAPPHFIWYLLAVMLGIAAWEWVQFAKIGQPVVRYLAGVGMAFAVAFVVDGSRASAAFVWSAIAVVGWLLAVLWLKKRQFGARSTLFERAVKLLAGLGIMLSCALSLGHLNMRGENGQNWVILLLLVIWAADTGAYFSGKRFGRKKLAPAISPGKTWEGVYGGLVTVSVVCLIAGLIARLPVLQIVGLILVGIATAAISVVGDLFASLMKRQVGLKDSSHLLPGHGGIVDRFDSLMAASPVFFVGVVLLTR